MTEALRRRCGVTVRGTTPPVRDFWNKSDNMVCRGDDNGSRACAAEAWRVGRRFASGAVVTLPVSVPAAAAALVGDVMTFGGDTDRRFHDSLRRM